MEILLLIDGVNISQGTVLFVKPKHFEFLNPELSHEVVDTGDRIIRKENTHKHANQKIRRYHKETPTGFQPPPEGSYKKRDT